MPDWKYACFCQPLSASASPEQIRRQLQIRQMSCVALLSIIFCMALVMQSFTLISGYCVPSNAPDVLALPHAIFLIAPYVLVFFGLIVFRFDLIPDYDSVLRNCIVMLVLCVLCIIAYVVQFVFSMVEVLQCQSTFCAAPNGNGYLIADLVAQGLFCIAFGLLAFWTWLFRRDYARRDYVASKREAPAVPRPTQVPPVLPKVAPAASNLRASMLKK